MRAINERYFEDYVPGAVHEYTQAVETVDEAEMLAFARRFDPQPIHVDAGYAAGGPFQGLIASGWFTAALLMRLFADNYLSRVASLASPGVDELRWPVPVRAGDRLWLRATVDLARPSNSKPDRGIVRTRCELVNQDGRAALTCVAVNLLLKRP
ncbi:MaoC family dehydratase [Dactylosporangium sp. CS-047395]|uniref:MaoC family dehydratase n=1 Tax=Dactylosporangium sp. CS-047395 TaxID=3239936 RepID=UPI003D8BC11C